MAKKQKYYAIRYVKDGKVTDRFEIVRTWDECKRKTEHTPNLFKSFQTEEEAKAWAKSDLKPNSEIRRKKKKPAKKLPTIPSAVKKLLTDESVRALQEYMYHYNQTFETWLDDVITADVLPWWEKNKKKLIDSNHIFNSNQGQH